MKHSLRQHKNLQCSCMGENVGSVCATVQYRNIPIGCVRVHREERWGRNILEEGDIR